MISGGCAAPGADDVPASLSGTSWALANDSLGVPVPAEAKVTMHFETDTVAGNAGCNNYSGVYTTSDTGALTFGPLAMTRMFCSPEVNDVETAFTKVLGTTQKYALDGDDLVLKDAQDADLARFTRA